MDDGHTLAPAALPDELLLDAYSQRMRRALALANTSGVLVTALEASGAAERAGLRAGDVIVRFAGQQVEGVDDLHRLLTDALIGHAQELTVVRAGKVQTLSVRPSADQR